MSPTPPHDPTVPIVIRARGSNLPYLLRCSRGYHERDMADKATGERRSNAAADTGNIFHALAAAHHRGQSIPAALKLAVKAFPLGDPKMAGELFNKYKSYAPSGAAVIEQELYLATTEAINGQAYRFEFSGTIDLVHTADGTTPARKALTPGVKYNVVDHKTGRPTVTSMVPSHWAQLALYGMIVHTTTGVWPGVYINHVRSGVMFPVPMTLESATRTLATVRIRLVEIHQCRTDRRINLMPTVPCDDCTYCTLEFPQCAGGGKIIKPGGTIMRPLFSV